jgi:hypothetical protein
MTVPSWKDAMKPASDARINPFGSPGFAVLIREANEDGLKPGVCSGLILSGALTPICKELQIGVWRQRTYQSRKRQPEFTLSGGNGTAFLFRSLMAFSILENSSSFNKGTLSP